jgi:hypothetical protein
LLFNAATNLDPDVAVDEFRAGGRGAVAIQ